MVVAALTHVVALDVSLISFVVDALADVAPFVVVVIVSPAPKHHKNEHRSKHMTLWHQLFMKTLFLLALAVALLH
jgi:hypothetical protein